MYVYVYTPKATKFDQPGNQNTVSIMDFIIKFGFMYQQPDDS